MTKILAISSPGGHWVQLSRLIPAFQECSVVFSGMYIRPSELNNEDIYYPIDDVSRSSFFKIPKLLLDLIRILRIEKPSIVITTGALPGLLAIVISRFLGIKTIWLDSIANSESVSASGFVASYVSNYCFTQWPELENRKIKYIGRVV